jgi:Holliday junction resolvase-like predicted endonuclease
MTDRTAITDFEIEDTSGTRYHIELKTRRNTHDKYATTMIGANKLEKAEKLFKEKGERTFFYFQFTD